VHNRVDYISPLQFRSYAKDSRCRALLANAVITFAGGSFDPTSRTSGEVIKKATEDRRSLQ